MAVLTGVTPLDGGPGMVRPVSRRHIAEGPDGVDPELIDFGAVRYNQFVEARFR